MNKHQCASRHARLLAVVLLAHSIATANTNAEPTLAQPSAKAEHVIVLVWDGLRPDSVNEQDTPTLFKLAAGGTTFAHHHSIFPSSTEVNGTAMATGGYPVHSGLMANHEYRPDIELLKPIATEELEAVRKGDELSGGKYLLLPTVADILKQNHRRSVIAGTKPVALLLDRAAREGTLEGSSDDLAQGKILPAAAQAEISAIDGGFPETADPTKSANTRQDHWTTRVLIDRLWHGDIPVFTTLWFSEPDYAQHGSASGSDVARSALKSNDDNLALVLAALDKAAVRDKTDVMIVSDHGFSTVSRTVNIAKLLGDAGFEAAEKFKSEPKPGEILVAGLGGATSFYVIGHDAGVITRLVEFLQRSDFAGVIFTRQPMEGTFTLEQARIDTAAAPDVVVSMRWSDEKSTHGLPGMVVSSAKKYTPGKGTHASLSRFDMHNTLIAAGPDFRAGFTDDLPSGNADIAPTVLALLGLTADAAKMDGRVLSEAINGGAAPEAPTTESLPADRNWGETTWRQYLRITHLGSRIYFDEGNAGADPNPIPKRAD